MDELRTRNTLLLMLQEEDAFPASEELPVLRLGTPAGTFPAATDSRAQASA